VTSETSERGGAMGIERRGQARLCVFRAPLVFLGLSGVVAFLVALVSPSAAATGTLTGRVTDGANNSLPGQPL